MEHLPFMGALRCAPSPAPLAHYEEHTHEPS